MGKKVQCQSRIIHIILDICLTLFCNMQHVLRWYVYAGTVEQSMYTY
jgi:hypothetical protein